MKYSYINEMDVYNGPGLRVTLFTQGCDPLLNNTTNMSLNDFNNGKEFDKVVEDEIIRLCSSKNISGLTISGGEPFGWIPHSLDYHPYYIKKYYDLYSDIEDKTLDDVISYYNTLSDDAVFDINPIYHLVRRFKDIYIDKNIWMYTSYDFNDLIIDKSSMKEVSIGANIALPYIDVIVKGRYIKDTLDFEEAIRGNSKYTLIDVKRSLNSNEIITYAKEA